MTINTNPGPSDQAMDDDDLRAALRSLATSATVPQGGQGRVIALTKRRRRNRGIAAGVGAGLAAAVIVAGVAVLPRLGSDQPPTAATESTSQADWRTLTGEAVGEALGLTPVDRVDVNNHPECLGDGNSFTTFGDAQQGFCYSLAQLGIDDPIEGELLAWQMMGFRRSPDLIRYVKIQQQRVRLMGGPGNPSHDELDRLDQLGAEATQLAQELGINAG